MQLRSVNEAMNEYVSSVSASQPTTALYHTLQRHNDILQDYSQEYNRTKVHTPLMLLLSSGINVHVASSPGPFPWHVKSRDRAILMYMC